ncbi:hypothetical protein SVIOM74S_04285 [Streptomyces violarus]
MGYLSFDQKTSGIHQRQRSRAYVVVDRATGKRVVYVNADLAMIFQSVQQGVIARLKERYGSLYGDENVLLSATHTHSGPGGYSHHVAYNLSVLGFQSATYRAIVDGIADSVAKAHDDLKPGTISLGTGTLTNASVNRSRQAFDRNPAAILRRGPGHLRLHGPRPARQGTGRHRLLRRGPGRTGRPGRVLRRGPARRRLPAGHRDRRPGARARPRRHRPATGIDLLHRADDFPPGAPILVITDGWCLTSCACGASTRT